MAEFALTVNLVLEDEEKTMSVPCLNITTAEDVCMHVCKYLNITTIARHLFALRITGEQLFLMPSAIIKEENVTTVDLRIRFKVASITKLKKIDVNAYNYYFQQARKDVLDNKIPDLVYDRFKEELVGLGITDMFRVMLEKKISRETVENDYKKYIPKEILKKHIFFIKKLIHTNLGRLSKSVTDASYVMAEYVKQLDLIAPEYLSEVYKAQIDQDGSLRNILVKVSPSSNIAYCSESKRDEWKLICTIEELGFISIRNNGAIEISRKNGIPFYLKFRKDDRDTRAFISLLDGYYRLTCKWTFNICKEVITPSLKKLQQMKCHGPVGGEFSYAKLEDKRANRTGCFIIRESETNYNTYYIDVCVKDSIKPKTYKVEKIKDEFIFNGDITRYKTIQQLIKAYSDPEGAIFLQECLPPSEYDLSQVLLCRSDSLVGDSIADTSQISELPSTPVCINFKDLQVYKVQKKEGSRGFTVVYKGMWRLTKGKKIEVAIKMLTQDSMETYLKDYLNLLGQWSFLRSPFIVRLFGIAFINNITSVLEFFKLGPLDQYLRDKRGILKSVDLVEAASNLASAVWHLKENDIVHGKIRCRKLMVSSHDENSFTVKLTDPGVHTSYEPSEVHWIPVEYHGRNLEHFKKTTAADVWALATTLYEIFTYGADIKISLSANYQPDYEQTIRWYASRRLQRPPDCPNEIYTLMLECWEADPHRRKQPQAISRDINQLLYQVYNSRKNHSYATVSKKPNGPSIRGNSEIGVISSPDCDSSLLDNISMSDATSQQYLLPSHDIAKFDITSEISVFFPNISCSTITTSLESLNSMQSVFELDDNWDVILQGRIGQGFYGEVFKGQLEKTGSNGMEVKRVAVKRLKSSTESSLCLQDFEREIEIMKTLRHPNIVEILGVLRNPEIALVMEYVQHGSLQSFLKINKETLKAAQLLKFGLDIAKGMEYLGKKNIVHRDLAARNILVADENHVKISDFGLAQVMGANDYYILKTPNRELPIRWYAPESLRDGKFSVRSDVWSFGVTMCEMFNYGEEPQLPNIKDYSDGQEPQALLDAIEGGARFPCPAFCQQAIYIRVIYPCWENDPHKRPLFRQIALEIEDLLMIQ